MRDSTTALFHRAGVSEGMRVLDVGSGAGDVAIGVARMVGSSRLGGRRRARFAERAVAERRAREAGFANVEILSGDVGTIDLPGPFHAAVGRLVLMHLPDPVAVLARLRRSCARAGWWSSRRPRGRAGGSRSRRHRPSSGRVRIAALASRWAAYDQMGLAPRGTYLGAGLPDPRLSVDAIIGGGPGWPGYRYLEEPAQHVAARRRRGCAGRGGRRPGRAHRSGGRRHRHGDDPHARPRMGAHLLRATVRLR
jgi:SAM-dependent methyltransferase